MPNEIDRLMRAMDDSSSIGLTREKITVEADAVERLFILASDPKYHSRGQKDYIQEIPNDNDDFLTKVKIAESVHTTPEQLEMLSKDRSKVIRGFVAMNPNTP